MEESKLNIPQTLKNFYEKSRRVWLTLSKPTKKEYEMVAKVSAIGIIILGLLGFLISIIIQTIIR
ncbi:MAG: protein translocase SEC61 complex subunit gamma [Candidatus Pacearchaeota archaeon]